MGFEGPVVPSEKVLASLGYSTSEVFMLQPFPPTLSRVTGALTARRAGQSGRTSSERAEGEGDPHRTLPRPSAGGGLGRTGPPFTRTGPSEL